MPTRTDCWATPVAAAFTRPVWESIIAAILSGVVTLIGVLIANSRSNAVMEYKIEELTREVRKHNGFAEKIPVIQRDIQVLNHRMSDIEVHEYEHERSNV